jgi:S1-C subfamily serine protease
VFEDVFKHCWQSIFAVFAEATCGKAFGTAFAVGSSRRHLATAAHVVSESRSVTVMQTAMGVPPQQRPTFSVKVVTVDPRTDLALLEMPPGRHVVPLQISPLPAVYGASALVIGYPATYRDAATAERDTLMVNIRVNGCTVASDMSLPPFDGSSGPPVEIFEVDANLHPGMSGAPVLNTIAEVTGIVSRGFLGNRLNLGLDETTYTVAIRAEHLDALLRTVAPRQAHM